MATLGAGPALAIVPSAIPLGCKHFYSTVVTCQLGVTPPGEPFVLDLPAEVRKITVTVRGGRGGHQYDRYGRLLAAGGFGVSATAAFDVDPSRDLEITVGAAGIDRQPDADTEFESDPTLIPGDGGPSIVRVAGGVSGSDPLLSAAGGVGAGTPNNGGTGAAGSGDGAVLVEWEDPQEPEATVTLVDKDYDSTQTYRFTASHPRVRFECSLDSGAWKSCVSPLRLTGLKDGHHLLQARAIDRAGRIGNFGSDGSWVDTKAPITKLNPGSGVSPIRPRALYVDFFSHDKDTTWFECKLDDGKWRTCSKKHKKSGSWVAKKLKPGKHTVRVRALDWAGNADPSPAKRSAVIR
ncbi:MAG: fibronectin type III domain-containing protein [Sporichthyaceae bacterium]